MENSLQKLISEYCAIEEVDRILREAGPGDGTVLVGMRAREMRRREILLELISVIGVAEDLVKEARGFVSASVAPGRPSTDQRERPSACAAVRPPED
jgi:hypothetical protein